MSKVKPLHDYVLIEPLEKETTLPSGIVLPDSAKEKPQEGKIIAVGTGYESCGGECDCDCGGEMAVKVGDIVMYKKWGGTEVKIDGKEHLLVKEEDLLAVIE